MAHPGISKTERAYLLLLGATISAVNLTNSLIVWLEKVYYPPQIEIYDFAAANLFPLGRFISIFIVIFLWFGKRYFLSLVWTVLSIAPFLYQFILAFRIIHYDVDLLYKTPALALIALIANPLDYFAFFLTAVLLLWLISVVVRSVITNDIDGLQ